MRNMAIKIINKDTMGGKRQLNDTYLLSICKKTMLFTGTYFACLIIFRPYPKVLRTNFWLCTKVSHS